jgi:hypothetical protein
MNRTILLAVLVGAFLGSGARTTASAGTGAAGKRAQGTEDAVSVPPGTLLHADLDTSLDSKKAKAGDAVTAHVTEAVKINGQTVIPKNAKLVGHVTQSTARSKGDAGSAMAVLFDKMVIKKGQEVPLKVVIQAMAAPARFAADGSSVNGPINAGGAAAPGSPMGPSHTPPGQVAAPPAGAANPAGNPPSAADDNSPGLDAAGRLTPSSHGVVGIEGLHLATDESSATEGSLITTTGKSVRLDGGIKLLLVSE